MTYHRQQGVNVSLINIFTRSAPTIAGFEFDAILEDTFEASVTLTGFTIELGARASDHRIINPFTWSLVGAVSNNPLRTSITDFVGAVTTGAGGVLSTVAGLSAGFLSGGDETRASSTLDFLITLMVSGEPFDIDAGDIQLTNMVIGRIRRTKNPTNEGGLIFEADMQEFPTLETVIRKNQPLNSQLREGDPSQTQSSATVNNGELTGSDPSASTSTAITEVLG